MHLPHHQKMLRNAAEHGGVDAVMVTIAKENPGVFRAAAIKEIREKQRLAEPSDALAATA